MNSRNGYIKGEEDLSNWKPRGVGLIQDFAQSQKRRQRASDVEAAKVFLRRRRKSPSPPPDSEKPTDHQKALQKKFLDLWTTNSHNKPLSQLSNTPSSSSVSPRPHLHPTIVAVPKNPSVLKSSYILTPSPSLPRWQRHFAELRPPYFHIYSVPSGDETAVINLRNARIDTDPPLQTLLQSERVSRNVFAIYAPMRSWLFASRSEAQKAEWVLAIDQGFAGEASGGG